MYYNGVGVPKDQDEGIRFMKIAADDGHKLAIDNLKTMKPAKKSFWRR
jgi:TPR repeat protein